MGKGVVDVTAQLKGDDDLHLTPTIPTPTVSLRPTKF